ncbi:MAG: phosphate/phosphite/phosphonate ABC transporter substrate-binding protein [Myxococcota bacterium]
MAAFFLPAVLALAQSAVARPLTITTLPFDDPSRQTALFALLSTELSGALGEDVVFEAGQSYDEVIQRLTSRKTDVAFLGGVAYLEARRRGNARAILKTVRSGRGSYRGVIFVSAASPIQALADVPMSGTVGFVDRRSTTGYFFPAALMREAGLNLDSARFLGTHQNVIEAVSKRKVDVGAAFESALEMLQDPAAIRVIATTEEVPGDPIVVRPGLGKARIAKLRSAFMELATRPEARPFFDFSGIDSLVPVTDSDYDSFAERAQQLTLPPK